MYLANEQVYNGRVVLTKKNKSGFFLDGNHANY